jgi:hypothetical protein
MANHTSNPSSKCYDTFVPYSYTFGSRYTNPFDGTSDLMIRGKLPLWCQTLFLSECIKQGEPIRANEPRSGLFPFAPHITVTFRSLADSYSAHDFTAYPEMTVLYERFTMENIDPYALPEGCGALHEDQWPERKKEVLEGMLLCDIPDSLAALLDDMATVWAASQGLIL